MHSNSPVLLFAVSTLALMMNIDAFFLFSAPPVVEEGEIQEPPSFIRLRRAYIPDSSESRFKNRKTRSEKRRN